MEFHKKLLTSYVIPYTIVINSSENEYIPTHKRKKINERGQ